MAMYVVMLSLSLHCQEAEWTMADLRNSGTSKFSWLGWLRPDVSERGMDLDLDLVLGTVQYRLKDGKVKFDSILHFWITPKCPTTFQEAFLRAKRSNLHPKPRAAECCQGSARSKVNLQSIASASHA